MESNKTDSSKICKHVTLYSDGFLVCVKCAFVQNDVVTTDNTSKENTSHDNLKTPQRLVNDRNDIFLELKSRGDRKSVV